MRYLQNLYLGLAQKSFRRSKWASKNPADSSLMLWADFLALFLFVAGEQVKYRHTYGYAVFYLF